MGGDGGIIKAIVIGGVLGAITGGIGFGLGFTAGTSVFGISAGIWSAVASGAAMGAIGGALNGIAGALMGTGEKKSAIPDFTYEAQDRTLSIQQAISYWRVLYGMVRVGGIRTFVHTTNNNQTLHVIYTVACHEVTSYEQLWLNEEIVTVNGDGTVSGKWAGKVKVYFGLGTTAGDAGLHAALTAAVGAGKWSSDHKQEGRAKVYVQYTYDSNLYSGGVPNASFVVKGKPVYDPRTSTTVWSANPKLCQYDYLRNYWNWPADEVDQTQLIASANICDEDVALAAGGTEKRYTCNGTLALDAIHAENLRKLLTADRGKAILSGGKWLLLSAAWQVPTVELDEDDLDGPITVSPRLRRKDLFNGVKGVFADPNSFWQPNDFPPIASDFYKTEDGGRASTFTANTSTDELTLADGLSALTGDSVQLWTTDTLPAPLTVETVYYVIGVSAGVIKLATTEANAEAGTAINLTSTGTGEHTIRFGERIWKDVELQFTTSSTMCQRIAKIDLLACRQQITVTLPCKLTAMRVQAGRTVMLTNSRMGWTQKAFEVTEWGFVIRGAGSDDDPPRLGIDLTLRETDSTVFDWSTDEEQTIDPAADTTFPNPFEVAAPTGLAAVSGTSHVVVVGGSAVSRIFISWTASSDAFVRSTEVQIKLSTDVEWTTLSSPPSDITSLYYYNAALATGYDIRARFINGIGVVSDWTQIAHTTDNLAPSPPGAPVVTESLYVTRDGSGVKAMAVLAIEASTDPLLAAYRYRYKLTTATAYTYLPDTAQLISEAVDLAPGRYTFEAAVISSFGVVSDYSVTTQEIYGLLAAPAQLTGLTISAISSFAIIRWTQSTDLDVRIGGEIRWRHSPLLEGATWAGSTSIGQAVPGSDTTVTLPLKVGTYLAKAVDSSGVEATLAATVTTAAATVLTFANVDTVTEDPLFLGTKTNCLVSGGTLYLAGGMLIDDAADFDSITDMDFDGGIASSGSYQFSAGIDLGAVGKVRLSSHLAATVQNILDTVDERTGNVDDWADFDGDAAASADAWVEVRATDDDPLGSPTWGTWQRLDVAEYENRAFEFQCVMTSDDPAYTIGVSELSVTAESLA